MQEVNHIPDADKLAKCPVCGNALQMDQWKWPECTKCPFRCALSSLPRISAAMELAKLEVKFENCKPEDEYKYQNIIEEARKHVLEVFK